MAILRNIISIILGAALAGCYQDFTPKVDTDPVLCLNSIITAGMPVEVDVSHSWVFDDEAARRDHSVADARVSVYANGREVGEGYVAAEGDDISIRVHSDTYGEAEAAVTVPQAVPFVQGDVRPNIKSMTKSDAGDDWFGVTIYFDLKVQLTIKDDPRCSNFFQLSRLGYATLAPDEDDYNYWTDFDLGQTDYEAEPIFGEHLTVFDLVMGASDGYKMIFSDRQFDGSEYTVTLIFNDCFYSVRWPADALQQPGYADALFDCGMTVYLASISRSYYDCLMYNEKVSGGMIGDLGDIGFAEPAWGYSNVSTGAGVVAACSYARFSFSLSDILREAYASE